MLLCQLREEDKKYDREKSRREGHQDLQELLKLLLPKRRKRSNNRKQHLRGTTQEQTTARTKDIKEESLKGDMNTTMVKSRSPHK